MKKLIFFVLLTLLSVQNSFSLDVKSWIDNISNIECAEYLNVSKEDLELKRSESASSDPSLNHAFVLSIDLMKIISFKDCADENNLTSLFDELGDEYSKINLSDSDNNGRIDFVIAKKNADNVITEIYMPVLSKNMKYIKSCICYYGRMDESDFRDFVKIANN